MKKILKRFKILFICTFAFFLTFLTLEVIPTSYDVVVPAIVDDISNVYSFEGYDSSNVHVNSVSIYEYYNLSVLGYLEAKLSPYSIIEKHNNYVNTSLEYSYSSGTIQKNVSLTNALIAGYKASSNEIDYEYKGAIVHSIYGSGERYFNIGDIIIECEGVEVSVEKPINRILQEKYGTVQREDGLYVNINLETEYSFLVNRKGEKKEVKAYAFEYVYDGKSSPILGISTYDYYVINANKTTPTYKIESPDSFGPSAGLMQSLFIYDTLSKKELTKNIKVVGTGTVDANGRAGAIGGVQAKVFAAYLSGADIFFVPKSNYEEALISYNKLSKKNKMEIVSVESLNDVINYLEALKGGTL